MKEVTFTSEVPGRWFLEGTLKFAEESPHCALDPPPKKLTYTETEKMTQVLLERLGFLGQISLLHIKKIEEVDEDFSG